MRLLAWLRRIYQWLRTDPTVHKAAHLSTLVFGLVLIVTGIACAGLGAALLYWWSSWR